MSSPVSHPVAILNIRRGWASPLSARVSSSRRAFVPQEEKVIAAPTFLFRYEELMATKELYWCFCTCLCIVNTSTPLARETPSTFIVSLGFPSTVLMRLIVIPAHSFMQTLSSSLSSLTYLQICPPFRSSFHPPPLFSILFLADSFIHKRYIAGYPLSMFDACRLFSDLSLPKQRHRWNTYLFSPPQHSPFFPPPCIKYSSDLCCVESTLHKTLNIHPPRQEPFVLRCLYVVALSAYLHVLFFFCSCSLSVLLLL